MTVLNIASTAVRDIRGTSVYSQESARQGRYGGSAPHQGFIRYGALHTSGADWANVRIDRCDLDIRLMYGVGGTSGERLLYVYGGAPGLTALPSGDRAAASRGRYIGAVKLSEHRLSGQALENLRAFLAEDHSEVLAIYTAEAVPSGENYSRNYMGVTQLGLTIEYTALGSSGALDRQSLAPGETIALALTPPAEAGWAEAAVTHRVIWRLGDHSHEEALAADALVSAFTLPEAWMDALPEAAQGTLQVEWATIRDGAEAARRQLSAAVRVPETAAFLPAVRLTAAASDGQAGYYQFINGAALTARAGAMHGARIVALEISDDSGALARFAPGDAGGAQENLSARTGVFDQSGARRYAARVTDSRGFTAQAALAIDVAAVHKPRVRFDAARYEAVEGEGETYRASDAGDHVWFDIAIECDARGGNGAEAVLSGAGQRVELALEDGLRLNALKDRGLITAPVPLDAAPEFTLTVTDRTGSYVYVDALSRARANLHLSGSDYGVGVGAFVTDASAENPLFRCAYPAKLQAGLEVAGDARVQGALAANDLTVLGGARLLGGVADFGGSVQWGETAAVSVAAGGIQDVEIAFERPFAAPPWVMAGFATASTAGSFGRCCVAVVPGGVTSAGFTARLYNGDSAARSPRVTWLALGAAAQT